MTMQPWDLSSVVDPRCRCPLHERQPAVGSAVSPTGPVAAADRELVARTEPTRMRGKPTAIPAVKCSPRSGHSEEHGHRRIDIGDDRRAAGPISADEGEEQKKGQRRAHKGQSGHSPEDLEGNV